jgi:hypothetical protein
MLGESITPDEGYGVVVDIAFDTGGVSVVAFKSGDASLYFSNGGGSLGGIGHETVREAAKKLVAAAAEQALSLPVEADFPLPQTGEVRFSVLTARGVRTAVVWQDLLVGGTALSSLYARAQDVITAFRELPPSSVGPKP